MEAEVLPVETQATRRMPRRSGLRRAAGHAVVLERAGGIVTLMLEGQAVEPAVARGAGRVEQRRVAFAQGDHVAVVVEERDELAEAPDAALVERARWRSGASRQSACSSAALARSRIDRLQQPAAARTVVDTSLIGKRARQRSSKQASSAA